MAKFVLAGRADCPYYAKAELLADYLQKNLPDFQIHKITQHPDTWEEWLQEICEKNGWKHKRSPIIWRELLDRGGKGLLLGGFNDFLEHAQHYYNVTSDMMTAEMRQIAEENLQTHIDIEQEEEELKSLINPLHIWINRASSHICYHLIPLLANGEIFGMETEVSLHLLDRSSHKEVLREVVMEAEDSAFPLLRSVSLHTELDGAFLQADVIILLDDILQETVPTLEDCIRQVTDQCKVYGPLIDKNAKSNVRIVVMGKTFSNLKALMLMMNAPSIDPQNIVTPALLECEAKAMLARKLNMHSAGIKNLIVWGNVSGNSFIDLSKTELYRYDSAIWGPPSYFRPLLDVLFDREWMRSEFMASLGSLSSWGLHCLGMAPAHVIATVLRYWYQDSPPKEIVSLGVISKGQFRLPEDIVFSMPVRFQNGHWEALTELEISEKNQDRLQSLASDLIREKQFALGEVDELYPPRRAPFLTMIVEEGESTSEVELNISSSGQVHFEGTSIQEPEELPDDFKESKSPEEENVEEPPHEKLGHPDPFPSVHSSDLPSSRDLGDKVFQAQQTENCNRPLGQEDTSRQVLSSVKVELAKTQESVKALRRESRHLRKQLNRRRGDIQLLHSAQEDGNRRLEAKTHQLRASQKDLMVELQKEKQGIKNFTKCNEESLKGRRFLNGPSCSVLKPSPIRYSDNKSLDPTSACPEQKWLLDPQTGQFTRNQDLESVEITPRKELFQSAKPEASHHRNFGVRRVLCCPPAKEPLLNDKGLEEEEELQQLVMKLKEALSFQVQPGEQSALKKELLSSAEHVSRSFSDLVSQVSLPARKCPGVAGRAAPPPAHGNRTDNFLACGHEGDDSPLCKGISTNV